MEKKTRDVEESPLNYLSESSEDREWDREASKPVTINLFGIMMKRKIR